MVLFLGVTGREGPQRFLCRPYGARCLSTAHPGLTPWATIVSPLRGWWWKPECFSWWKRWVIRVLWWIFWS